jgi:uncharacterized membrane protein
VRRPTTTMVTLSQAKMLGGIGSILVFIPFVSVLGYILVIIAVNGIANDLQDRSIFRNMLGSVIAGIAGALLGAVVVIEVLTGSFSGSLVAGLITLLLLSWVCLLLSAIFLRRSYGAIASRLGVGIFKTAATLYLVGAALTIVLIGFLVLFVAQILQAVAYFSMPAQPPPSPSAPPYSQGSADWTTAGATSPVTSGPVTWDEPTKFCTNCGSKIAASAVFCNQCGARQP